ncbi:MAG TPA: hypothetical protein VNB94_09955 [Mycobacteriales bacterium]|nr:hypothetical protein [Mycobacteriales bacterium]
MNRSRVVAALSAASLAGGLSGPSQAQSPPPTEPRPAQLLLPTPTGEIPLVAPEVVTPERRRTTFVPGPVRDDERIVVRLLPDGSPARVTVTQRLLLRGTGDFAIRERGPALRVTALDGTTAPIIQRGTVVWQGFVPGERALAADLELDPAREALVLPLRVEIGWQPTSGTRPIGPGGVLPGAGRALLRLVNQTARPVSVPTGDVAAVDLAGPLDLLRSSSADRTNAPPPVAGRGLPRALRATGVGTRTLTVSAPLRIAGTVTVPGAGGVAVSGPGTVATAAGDGAALAGVLQGSAQISLDVPTAGRLVLDLTVVPALDPRQLTPPAGAASWRDWAATRPDADARRAATDVLVAAAAAAARADDVAPYLGHPGPGPTSTVFRYSLAEAQVRSRRPRPVQPRPVPIALTALGAVAVIGAGVATWRRL